MGGKSGLSSIALLLFLVQLGCFQLASGDEDLDAECHSLGFNPHPEDCWRFLVCTEDADGNLIAHEHSCPKHQVYSHQDKGCVQDQVKACKRETPASDPDCGGKVINCLHCNTLIICEAVAADVYLKISTVPCTSGQFCDSSAEFPVCSSVKPPGCDPHGGCTAVGAFPDINNCSVYYDCTPPTAPDVNLTEKAIACDKGYVFSEKEVESPTNPSKDNHCKHRDSPADCITVQCTGAVEMKPYAKDSAYYVLCTGVKIGYVFKCSKDGDIYDPTSKGCKTPSLEDQQQPRHEFTKNEVKMLSSRL